MPSTIRHYNILKRKRKADDDPVTSYYFRDLGQYYKPLSTEEESDLVYRLKNVRTSMQFQMLLTERVEIRLREIAQTMRSAPHGSNTVAKMGADYNNKKRGLNQKIDKRIKDALLSGGPTALLRCDYGSTWTDNFYTEEAHSYPDY